GRKSAHSRPHRRADTTENHRPSQADQRIEFPPGGDVLPSAGPPGRSRPMRTAVIYLGTLFLVGYAARDWYKSLCGLIVMTAVLDNSNMPREMFGIGGLNPWHRLFFAILPAWLLGRRRERLRWDMPRHMNLLLFLYVTLIVVGFVRLLVDRGPIVESTGELLREYLLNTLKYMVPGLLLFDGARDRPRFVLGMASLLAVYVIVALLVIKWMP